MARVILELIAESNQLLRGIEQAQKQVQQFERAAESAGASLGSGVNRALGQFANLASGGALAAGTLVGAFAAAATAAVHLTLEIGEQLDALDRLSQRTGIAVQTLQGWSVVMAENDFQAESLATAMNTLSKGLTDAQDPANKSAAAFEELGIDVASLRGSTESALRAIAERFAALPDGPQKARLAIELFGRSGLDLIPILNRGAAALDESREAAQRFGLVLSQDQVRALTAAEDAAARLGKAFQGLKTQLALAFAPAVESGVTTLTNAIAALTNVVRNYARALEDIKKEHPFLSAIAPGVAAALALGRAAQTPPPVPPPPPVQQDAHVLEREQALAERQVALGLRIRDQLIEKFRLLQAEEHAQEALGRFTVDRLQREHAEAQKLLALQLEQAEATRNLQFAPVSASANKILDERLAAVKQLRELMPELNAQEASLLALFNQEQGFRIVQDSIAAYARRNEELEIAVERARALDEVQQSFFATERGLLGASEAARRVRFELIDQEAELEKRRIDETIFDEERKAAALEALDLRTEARRRQALAQFPTFLEQQLQSVVQSNSFSVGQIVSTWTSGLAQVIVKGGELRQVWEQTMIFLVQAALNTAVQMAASAALAASANSAAAATSASAWTAAGSAISATVAAMAAGVKVLLIGLARAVVGVVGIVVSGVSVVLNSISTVIGFMLATIGQVLIELGTALQSVPIIGNIIGAILIGAGSLSIALGAALPGIVAGLTGALAAGVAALAGAIPALAHGGIVTGPTLALLGEAGPEAVVPLDRGRAGWSGEQTIVLELNGRELARQVLPWMPGLVRLRVGNT